VGGVVEWREDEQFFGTDDEVWTGLVEARF
jgi:hypothetical protein